MTQTKKLLALSILFSLISVAGTVRAADVSAAMKGVTYHIDPLYGYETVFRNTPNPHTSTRAMYGARLSAGIDPVSGELEYTKASDTETYQTAPESIKNDDENLKLGILSTYRIGSYFFISGRAGGQATKNTNTQVTNGVSVATNTPIAYHPYAGAQLGVRIGKFSISAGSTAVIKDINDMSQNTYQNTLSLGVGY